MTKRSLVTPLVMMSVMVCAGPALADLPNEALVCPADAPTLDAHSLLRAMSLDLRGDIPEVEEYAAIGESKTIPDALIEDWLASEAFVGRAVRKHRDLLWNSIRAVNLTNTRASLGKSGQLYWVRARATMYRGDSITCLDEPVTYTADGQIATTMVTDPDDGQVSYREGWVFVAPYWDPEAQIKVCAFDAQSVMSSASGTSCGTRDALTDPGCGCGPGLMWCRWGNTTQRPVQDAMARDLELRIAAVVGDDEPYTNLFTNNRAFVNGPLVHFYKHLTPFYANARLEPNPIPVDKLPDLQFTDVDTWVEIELDKSHAGIVTSPAFLLRFQTNRARANRFYNAFLCQPFQPPQGGIPFADEKEALIPDLQLRAGCKYCHSLLEPSASYWGRWTENGAGYLDPVGYPAMKADCETCATTAQGCSAICNLYYVVDALSPETEEWFGWLKAYEFRRPEHMQNIEVGPRVLALQTVVDHRLPTCVARTTAEWLLGRALVPSEGSWLHALSIDFVAEGYSYRKLVKAIVTSPIYGRVR